MCLSSNIVRNGLSYLQNITCYIMQYGYEVKVDLVVHFVAMEHFFQEIMNLVP